jgi:cytochrome bd-type quinol oxidase subunit 2
MSRQRRYAILTGYSLILMAVVAGFALGYAFPKFFDANQPEMTLSNLSGNLKLYHSMLIGIVMIIILDILVSWTIYQFFKNDNKRVASMSFILRIIYTVIFVVATYFLVSNLGQGNNNELLNSNFNSFKTAWSIGLIVFGLHLLAVGILMKVHRKIPKVLWILTLIAGFSYVVVHILKTMLPQLADFTVTLNNVLALPMAVGELGLAIWLIIKGGNPNSIKSA